MNFIYGSVVTNLNKKTSKEEYTFEPIDGQQRLTTLFLLYWYIGSRELSPSIQVKYMIDFIKRKNVRKEFNYEFIDRSIIPDGGILYLVNRESEEKLPLVIAEISGNFGLKYSDDGHS